MAYQPAELRKEDLGSHNLRYPAEITYKKKLHYIKAYFKYASKETLEDLIPKLSKYKDHTDRYNATFITRFIRHFSGDVKKGLHAIFDDEDYLYGKEGQRFIEYLYDILPENLSLMQMQGGAFPVDHESKQWTRRKTYKKWVRKLSNKKTRHTKKEDLCVGEKSICKGHLGIPRKYMPQFNSPAEIRQFTRFVKRAYGIRSYKTRKSASQLKSSQREINRKRVKGLIDENILKKVNVPILISGDDYVIDGHHRWAAYKLKAPEKKMPAVVIEAPIKDVLGIAVAWGAKHQEF